MKTIDDIQNMNEAEAKAIAEEILSIKGHTVYLADLGEYFGFSALVFADGRHIYYANDYALHHAGKTKEELRAWYERKMKRALFTEDELRTESDDFETFRSKEYYLMNYFPMRREYQSIWHNPRDPLPEWFEKGREAGTIVQCSVNLGFYKPEDRDFVARIESLWNALHEANDPLRDYEHAKNAFKSEMYNHEYPINWQGDWDVIGCFCKVKYKGDGSEIEQTGWTDEIKRAYRDAAAEVRKNFNA